MIEAINDEKVINRIGGRFRLTSLIQRRWLELMQGSRPLVDVAGKSELETVIEEIVQGKIGIDYEASGIAPPIKP